MKHHGFDLGSVIHRHELLKILAAAGAAAALPGAAGFSAQTNGRVNKLTARGGAIDVHHHHQPPGLAGGGRGSGARGGQPAWTPALSIEQMDKFGIAAAILSTTPMGDILYDATPKGRAAVRTANEYAAKLMQDNPKRFGVFAAVPLPDLEGCLKEIEYAYDIAVSTKRKSPRRRTRLCD